MHHWWTQIQWQREELEELSEVPTCKMTLAAVVSWHACPCCSLCLFSKVLFCLKAQLTMVFLAHGGSWLAQPTKQCLQRGFVREFFPQVKIPRFFFFAFYSSYFWKLGIDLSKTCTVWVFVNYLWWEIWTGCSCWQLIHWNGALHWEQHVLPLKTNKYLLTGNLLTMYLCIVLHMIPDMPNYLEIIDKGPFILIWQKMFLL